MIKVGIIIGSTRPGRKAATVGRWVHEIASRRNNAHYELADIESFYLPLLDKPVPPSHLESKYFDGKAIVTE